VTGVTLRLTAAPRTPLPTLAICTDYEDATRRDETVLGTKKAGKNSGELFPRKLQTDGSTSSVKTSKHEKMSENWS